MSDTPPQWALDKAAKAAGWVDWKDFCKTFGPNTAIYTLAIAHAATLAKYETEPVEIVTWKERGRLADAMEFWDSKYADEIRSDELDETQLAALRHFIDTYKGAGQ